MTGKDLFSSLETAISAARAAGDLLRKSGANGRVISSEAGRDVKIAADVQAESVIIGQLQGASRCAILSEERGEIAGTDGTALRWIIDPLDGTFNFLRGIPFCAVSIALWRADEPLVGVVHDFGRDETFSGIVGQGAWVDGESISVSPIRPRHASVLCGGLPVSDDFSEESVGRLVRQFRDYKKFRLLGSAALSLAYVASGRADAYHERNIKLWDVAAGLAIVKAAGGEIAIEPSSRPEVITVHAANARATWPD